MSGPLHPVAIRMRSVREAPRTEQMHLFEDNTINSIYCLEDHLKPSRIQDKGRQRTPLILIEAIFMTKIKIITQPFNIIAVMPFSHYF